MHDIEPYYKWIGEYEACRDEKSPFYGREYSEFTFHNKVYNYYIHPRWDDFGSSTLYLKILYASYDSGFAIIELIGEWNDCLHNDVMLLKRNVIDVLVDQGISEFVLIVENVLNFHADDDDYYAEWYEEIIEEEGFICFLNPLDHVRQELNDYAIDRYIHYGELMMVDTWRRFKPADLMKEVKLRMNLMEKRLT